MEKRYVIKWEIDEFATSPLDAIRKAILSFPHEKNEDSQATVFDVEEIDINSNKVVNKIQIDTLDEGCNPFQDNKEETIEEFNTRIDAINKQVEEDEGDEWSNWK